MMFAYLSIFKIMGGLFYTGETNSKRQESTLPFTYQISLLEEIQARCLYVGYIGLNISDQSSFCIFENPSQRNANCHKPEARSSFILPGSKARLVAVSLNNIDLVIVLSLHNFCRNGHGDSGNYQVPSYQSKVTVSSPMLTSPRSSLVLQLHGRLAGVVEVGSLLPHIISQLHARLATPPREAGISQYCSTQIRRDLDCTVYCLKYFSFYLGTNLGKIVTNLAIKD